MKNQQQYRGYKLSWTWKAYFFQWTINQISYGQTLLFYKDDINALQKNRNLNLILEQDGASCYTSKTNIFLLDKLFKDSGWIQNPPNSPDLAFPIEKIWGIIKPQVKKEIQRT